MEYALKCIRTSEFVFHIHPDFVTTGHPEKQLHKPHISDFFYYNFLEIKNTNNYIPEEAIKEKTTKPLFVYLKTIYLD